MNKLSQVAAMVRKAGAAGSPDSVLAHITPKEAAMLKARGGSGRIDPNTGLPHFEDDSDSTSYGGTQTGGSWAGQSNYSDGINSVGAGGGHSDPSYSAKGYYSAAGDYDDSDSDGSGSTRYYDYRKTIGGNLAESLGFDPEGLVASIGNGAVSALGYVNPMFGLVGKIAQSGVASDSIPSPPDMDGKGGSMNFAGRLLTGGKTGNPLSDAIASVPEFQASPVRQGQSVQYAHNTDNQSSGGNSVQQSYDELLRKRRKKA